MSTELKFTSVVCTLHWSFTHQLIDSLYAPSAAMCKCQNICFVDNLTNVRWLRVDAIVVWDWAVGLPREWRYVSILCTSHYDAYYRFKYSAMLRFGEQIGLPSNSPISSAGVLAQFNHHTPPVVHTSSTDTGSLQWSPTFSGPLLLIIHWKLVKGFIA